MRQSGFKDEDEDKMLQATSRLYEQIVDRRVTKRIRITSTMIRTSATKEKDKQKEKDIEKRRTFYEENSRRDKGRDEEEDNLENKDKDSRVASARKEERKKSAHLSESSQW